MPIYEYTCTSSSCGHEFERLRPMSSMDDPAPCPECDSESRRGFSVFAAFTSNAEGQMSSVAGAGGGCCGGGGACACAMGV